MDNRPIGVLDSGLGGLTVLKKVIERKTTSQIAKEMNIMERSLENYFSKIYMKTGCKNHEDLIKEFGE